MENIRSKDYMNHFQALLNLETIEHLDKAIFVQEEIYKMVGLDGDDHSGSFVKVSKAADKINIACISFLETGLGPDSYMKLNQLNLESGVKHFVFACSHGEWLYVSSLMIYGKKCSTNTFERALDDVHRSHIDAREMLVLRSNTK